MLKRTEHGWQFSQKPGRINTHYVSFMNGVKHEWIRPWLSRLFCLLAGCTYNEYYQCRLCGRRW